MSTLRHEVGVVIRVHDAAPYLVASIQSVLMRDPPAAEVVVVDDGSTDGSGLLAEAFVPRVRVIRQRRRGPGGAINAGLLLVRREFVAFQDADDLWTPGRLGAMAAELAARPEADGVMGRVEHFASEDLSAEEAARFDVPGTPQPGAALPSLLIRREVLDRVGCFDESLRAGEYLEWHDRAIRAGVRIEPIEVVCLRRRVHRTNTTRSAEARRDYLRVARLAIARHRGQRSA